MGEETPSMRGRPQSRRQVALLHRLKHSAVPSCATAASHSYFSVARAYSSVGYRATRSRTLDTRWGRICGEHDHTIYDAKHLTALSDSHSNVPNIRLVNNSHTTFNSTAIEGGGTETQGNARIHLEEILDMNLLTRIKTGERITPARLRTGVSLLYDP